MVVSQTLATSLTSLRCLTYLVQSLHISQIH